jgi:hypothetical protein
MSAAMTMCGLSLAIQSRLLGLGAFDFKDVFNSQDDSSAVYELQQASVQSHPATLFSPSLTTSIPSPCVVNSTSKRF